MLVCIQMFSLFTKVRLQYLLGGINFLLVKKEKKVHQVWCVLICHCWIHFSHAWRGSEGGGGQIAPDPVLSTPPSISYYYYLDAEVQPIVVHTYLQCCHMTKASKVIYTVLLLLHYWLHFTSTAKPKFSENFVVFWFGH